MKPDGQFAKKSALQPPAAPTPDWVLNSLSDYGYHEIPNHWEYA
jgi:hypothetical protein